MMRTEACRVPFEALSFCAIPTVDPLERLLKLAIPRLAETGVPINDHERPVEFRIIEDAQVRMYEVQAYWNEGPALDDPDVIDLEILEECPVLPAGA